MRKTGGKLIHTETKSIQQGNNTFSLSIRNRLADGVYFVQQIENNKSTATKVWVY